MIEIHKIKDTLSHTRTPPRARGTRATRETFADVPPSRWTITPVPQDALSVPPRAAGPQSRGSGPRIAAGNQQPAIELHANL